MMVCVLIRWEEVSSVPESKRAQGGGKDGGNGRRSVNWNDSIPQWGAAVDQALFQSMGAIPCGSPAHQAGKCHTEAPPKLFDGLSLIPSVGYRSKSSLNRCPP